MAKVIAVSFGLQYRDIQLPEEATDLFPAQLNFVCVRKAYQAKQRAATVVPSYSVSVKAGKMARARENTIVPQADDKSSWGVDRSQ